MVCEHTHIPWSDVHSCLVMDKKICIFSIQTTESTSSMRHLHVQEMYLQLIFFTSGYPIPR